MRWDEPNRTEEGFKTPWCAAWIRILQIGKLSGYLEKRLVRVNLSAKLYPSTGTYFKSKTNISN